MKRPRRALAAALIALVLPAETLAAQADTYLLEELRMEVTVPEGLTVFLREAAAEDPDAQKLDLDGTALAEGMKEQGVYLAAMSADKSWELSVGMVAEEGTELIFDFNLYDRPLLRKMGEEMITGTTGVPYKTLGYTIETPSVFQGEQARFLAIDSTQVQGEKTICRRQYYTIYNGQAINLVLVAYDGKLTEEQTGAIQALVESVHFTESLPIPREARQVAAQAKRTQSPYRIGVQAVGAGAAAGVLTWVLNRKKSRTAVKTEEKGSEQENESGQ